jgi:uncharacterized RDD family membrane protein YckC
MIKEKRHGMDKVTITTPENIALEYELAGLGSRMIGAIIDHLLQGGLLALVFLALVLLGPGGRDSLNQVFIYSRIALMILLSFAIVFGYFVFFETIWAGQTPGKKAAHIQVIKENGEPVGFMEALLRNLFRMVDFLPFYYLLGIVVFFVNPMNKRLGDMAAGTIVVRQKHDLAPSVIPKLAVKTDTPLDVSQVTGEEYSQVRNFILRRDSLKPEHRARIGTRLASHLERRMDMPPGEADPEELIEAVAVEYRNRRKTL